MATRTSTPPKAPGPSPASVAIIEAQSRGEIPRRLAAGDVTGEARVLSVALRANGWTAAKRGGMWKRGDRIMILSPDGRITVLVERDETRRAVAHSTVSETAASFLEAADRVRAEPPQPPRIDTQEGFATVSSLEGKTWARRQLDDEKRLRDPEGWFANRAAWQVLRDLGPDGAGLTVSDLVPGSGLVLGSHGRAYVLVPDGHLVLLAETADETFRTQAAQAGVPIQW